MAKQLGQVAVGTIVKLNENGSPVDFVVGRQNYESGLNGNGRTLLIRIGSNYTMQWGPSSMSDPLYAASTVDTWLNTAYKAMLDAPIQEAIATTKFYYTPSGGASRSTLERAVFLGSATEFGFSNSPNGYVTFNTEGSPLPEQIIDKIQYPPESWTRTPTAQFRVAISTHGSAWVPTLGAKAPDFITHVDPFFTLPSTLYVDDDGEISPIPLAPGSIDVPVQVMVGKPVSISWSAVDGAVSYTLERSADGGGWSQIYSGANTSYTDTAGEWENAQYRVRAYANGVYSDYATSETVPVAPLSALVISGSDGNLGTLTNDVQYSVSSSGTSTLTVTETINGVNTRTYTATNGAENKISVVDLPTGTGTIKITASTNPGSGVVSVTRNWTYTKTAITFPDAGSVADLTQQGKTIWPKTIAEAVRTPGIWGGNLGLALDKLARSVLYNRTQQPKYAEVKINLATAKEGNIISLPENGQMVEFYVAKLDYESGLNGTGRVLVVRKDLYIARPWDADGVNAYSTSDIDIWMESTYKPMLDSSVQSEIGTTKIYYTPGNGNDTVTTLERGVFQLSATEMGGTGVNFNVEGTVLPISETLQQASNGPQIIWTRTPTIGRTNTAISLSRNPNPSFDNTFCTATQKWYYRPAFTLPSTFTATYYVDTDGTAHDEQEYDEAGTFTDISGGAIPIVSTETISPPMQTGVEYRTTERYNGKPVFVMAVDGGVFPNSSSKTIEVQIPDTSGQVKMLDCYGVLDNGTQIPGLFGESVFDASNYLGLFTQNGNGKFTISVGSGRTVGLNFTLFLKYWKEGT